jgi:uncharacterized membrane protein
MCRAGSRPTVGGMTEPTYETPLPNYARVSPWRIAGAVGFHLLAGTVWFLISVWAWLDRYLFCSDEPGWLGALLLVMAAMWVCGAILIGWARSRGEQVWHWTVAWLALSTFVFMVAVYSGPEPTHCGLF